MGAGEITLSKKVCVVTGSSSGIGAATARLYARQGWDVVINFSRDAAPAEAVATECRALGANVLVVKADVASNDDCVRLAAEVEARFGRADVLVNNAGTTKFVGLKDLDGLEAEDFHRIYSVNVIGAYQMIRALAPLLKKNPGAGIVNVSGWNDSSSSSQWGTPAAQGASSVDSGRRPSSFCRASVRSRCTSQPSSNRPAYFSRHSGATWNGACVAPSAT